MELVMGIFNSRNEAEKVIDELISIGIPKKQIGLLIPGMSDSDLQKIIPVSDTEGPGLGKAMGATVGTAVGAAGGATLGAAAASLAVPGVGPVIAIGLVGAALAGIAGGVTGAVAGETLEEALGEGLPHEDLYVYEEAMRRGHSIVVAFTAEEQAQRARDIMSRNGVLDFNDIRDSWWSNLRNDERRHYQNSGRDFEGDELSYRRGFQAALHAKRRGQSYAKAEPDLRKDFDDSELDTAFRHGYERGLRYQITVVEIHKV